MDYEVLPPSERARLARDRLTGLETRYLQIEIAEVAGDHVDQGEKEKVEKAINALRSMAADAEAAKD